MPSQPVRYIRAKGSGAPPPLSTNYYFCRTRSPTGEQMCKIQLGCVGQTQSCGFFPHWLGQRKGTPLSPPSTPPPLFFWGGGGSVEGEGGWQQQYWYCGRKGWGAQGLWACSGWVNDQLVSYLPQSDLSAGSGTDSIRLHNCKLSQIINEHFCACYI